MAGLRREVLGLTCRAQRAVSCVLDNAVRAAGPGGQVTVEVTGTERVTPPVEEVWPGGLIRPGSAERLSTTGRTGDAHRPGWEDSGFTGGLRWSMKANPM